MSDELLMVMIRWRDSQTASGWAPASEMLRTVEQHGMKVVTLGFLFAEYEDRVVVVSHQADNGNVADAMSIPRESITSICVIDAGRTYKGPYDGRITLLGKDDDPIAAESGATD